MSGTTQGGTAAAQSPADKIKAVKDAFETGWMAESTHLSALTSDDWHSEKKLAAVKSAKWFQKSNNIGPKLDKLQAARAKLDKQANRNNYQAVVGAIVDLDKALIAFKKNREGATPQQTKDINAVVDTYSKIAMSAGRWLTGQEKQIAILDKAELAGILKK